MTTTILSPADVNHNGMLMRRVSERTCGSSDDGRMFMRRGRAGRDRLRGSRPGLAIYGTVTLTVVRAVEPSAYQAFTEIRLGPLDRGTASLMLCAPVCVTYRPLLM